MKDMFIDLAKYRIQRAFENKGDAEILFRSERITDTVNRIYQANFYAVKSLLATKMKDSAKQQLVFQIFQENFVLTGEVPKEYGQIVDRSYRCRDEGERHEKLQVTAREAQSMMEDCEKFLGYVREYIKQFIIANPRRSSEVFDNDEEGQERRGENKSKNKK
jgi:uncharacterized protein (UPF0332 family)